jgi:type VI secretion system secreted protein VgrG
VSALGSATNSCNGYGDIMIKFLWDNDPVGIANITNICWVRVVQMMAGKQYGTAFIPRPAQEVLVGFLYDDIDSPVVLGTLTNEMNTPFYGDQLNKLSIKTNSIGQLTAGERFNELTFDDLNNRELVYLRGQKDMALEIMDGNFSVKMHGAAGTPVINSIEITQGDMSIKLQKGNYNTVIEGDCDFKVSGNLNWEVGNNFSIKAKSLLTDIDEKIKISSDNIDLLSTNKMNFSCNSMELSTSNDFLLESTSTTIKSKANTLLQSSGSSTIDTSGFNIKAQGMLTISAPGIFNITSGVFALNSTTSVSIVAPLGTLHGFPPFYI